MHRDRMPIGAVRDLTACRRLILEPQSPKHRQYEALRETADHAIRAAAAHRKRAVRRRPLLPHERAVLCRRTEGRLRYGPPRDRQRPLSTPRPAHARHLADEKAKHRQDKRSPPNLNNNDDRQQQEVRAAKVTAPYDAKVPGGLLPAGAGTSADRFVSMVYAQLRGGK